MRFAVAEDIVHEFDRGAVLKTLRIGLFMITGVVSVICTLVAIVLNGVGLFYHPAGFAISFLRYLFCGVFLLPLAVVVMLGMKRVPVARLHGQVRIAGYSIGALLIAVALWLTLSDPGDAIIYNVFTLCGLLVVLSCWIDRLSSTEG